MGKTIVTQLYGQDAANSAAEQFEKIFAQKQLPDEIQEIEISAEPVMASKLIVTCGLAPSGAEAKRLVKQSAVTVDGNKLTDPNEQITPKNGMVLQVGKRRFAKLKVK